MQYTRKEQLRKMTRTKSARPRDNEPHAAKKGITLMNAHSDPMSADAIARSMMTKTMTN